MKAVESDRYVIGRSAPLRVFAPDDEPRAELGGRSRAELVKAAASAVLGGVSVGQIVRDWNEAGYPSPQGGWWSRTGLTKLLRNPTLCGYGHRAGQLLDVNGADLTPESGAEPMRAGAALLDEQTWAELDTTLAARRTRRVSSNQSLLRGLVRCGSCERNMVRNGGPVASNGYGGSYVCTQRDQAGRAAVCSGNGINARRVETIVSAAVLHVLADPELLGAARAANAPNTRRAIDDLQARVDRLYRRLEEIEELWLDTDVKDASAKARFDRRRTKVESEIKLASAQLADQTSRSAGRAVAALMAEDDLKQAYLALAAPARSLIISELIEHVVIAPGRKGARFDPNRISIRWAQD